MEIGRDFDGIFQIDLGNSPGLVVTNVALATELADPARFRKVLNKALLELRTIVGDGLFTARTEEPNWAVAHRVLMPAFGQRAMRGYFPMNNWWRNGQPSPASTFRWPTI
jgi:cytochrome P450/NADPH-cytochrome P450 reductase